MNLCGFEVGLDRSLFLIAGRAGASGEGPRLRGSTSVGVCWDGVGAAK